MYDKNRKLESIRLFIKKAFTGFAFLMNYEIYKFRRMAYNER